METSRAYLRVSEGRGGKSESTDEQAADLARDAAEQGWQVGEPYVDYGKSASRYAKGNRDDFDRLMADLKTGQFGAGILALWESSRGSRRVGEWVSLLDTLEDAGVRVWVSTDERLFNPRIPGDRKTLLSAAVDSEFESARTRQRVVRGIPEQAAKGRPHALAPFGYVRRYDPVTRQLVGQEIVADEAEVVRTIYRRLDQGHSLRAITLDLQAQGVRSRAGRPLVEQVVREIATRPTYAARRVYQEKTYAGTWEAIVDGALFDRVQALLNDPRRRTQRDGQGRHLLSMLVYCGKCQAPLTASQRGGRAWHYRCRTPGCGASVNLEILDGIATRAMLGYLARPDIVETLTRARGEDPEVEKVRAELDATRRQLVDLAKAYTAKAVTIEFVARAEPGLLAEVARLERRERDLTLPSALAAYVGPAEVVKVRWEGAPLPARRAVARLLLSPGLLGRVSVGPDLNRQWCPEHRAPQCECKVWDRLAWQRV